MNYDEALETALNLAQDPAALETFLGTLPAWRGQLQREVRLASSIGPELRAIAPTAAGVRRRQDELLDLVARSRTQREPAAISRLAGLLATFARPRLLASATIAAAILVVALVAGLPALSGSGPTTVEAVFIEGSVSEIGAGAVTISTADSAELVTLSSDTVLTDGFGNQLQPSALNAGQNVVLKGSRSENGFVASQVELKDRLFGTVTALTGESISLRSAQGEHTIAITSATEMEGAVRVGAYVEVKLLRLADGSLRALEIETEDDESDGGDDRRESPSTPTSGSPAPGDTPAAGGPNSEDGHDEEEHEVEEEHGDEGPKNGEDDEDQSPPEGEEEHEEED